MAEQNISNLELGDIFEGIGNIINVVSKMTEESTQVSGAEELPSEEGGIKHEEK